MPGLGVLTRCYSQNRKSLKVSEKDESFVRGIMKKREVERSVNFFLLFLMIPTIVTIVVLVQRKENNVRNPEKMESLGLRNSGVKREDTTNPKERKAFRYRQL